MTYELLEKNFAFVPRRFFFMSLFIHLIFFIFFIWTESKQLFNNKKNFNIYEQYIQVDMIGLPEVPLKDLHTIDPTLRVDKKESPKKEETILPEPLVENKTKSLDNKKHEDALRKKALAELALEKAREDAIKNLSKSAKRVTLKGNIISKGTSSKGKIGTAKQAYEALVVERVKKHFNVYPWHKKKNLVAIIFIRIDRGGIVIEKRTDLPSSDPLFDSSVLAAIDASQPFPLPEDFSIVERGIRIEFRPED